MAFRFKVLQIEPLKDATDEVVLPAGWEPFQVDRTGGTGGWVVCLRMDDGAAPPKVESP
ncbi:MAG TPA: hypothetical protein VGH66_18080 [Acidimicrobiales bacterium]|jgi:hypothetical protein